MNLLDPCPYAECAAIGEHHHEIARGVVNPYPLPMECPRAARDGEFLKRHYYGK